MIAVASTVAKLPEAAAGTITFAEDQRDRFVAMLVDEVIGETVTLHLRDGSTRRVVLLGGAEAGDAFLMFADYESDDGTRAAENPVDYDGPTEEVLCSNVEHVHVL